MNGTETSNTETISTVTVNGQKQQTTQQTIALIIHELGLNKGRYAVEVDGELTPKTKLANTAVHDGMIIEVVQAVGGG